MKNKTHEIVLSVIGILTILVTAVGVTFAYFTASMSGTAKSITATTGRIGTVTFNGGANFTSAGNIEPGWSESKTFSISVAPSSVSQTVYVKMDYTNTMPDLTCNVTPTGSGAKGNITLNTTGASTTVVLVEKTFPASTSTQSVTYTYAMALPETGVNQYASQGKIFNATLYASFGADLYYNNANPTGTTTKPTAN